MTSQICCRCDKPTDKPVVVQIEHGGSGAGWTRYACPGCAPSKPRLVDTVSALAAQYRALRRR